MSVESRLERNFYVKRHFDYKMLIQFSVGNFRSFADIQTLNLAAAPISSFGDLDLTNVFSVRGDLKLLRSAAVYGANASGKSNLFLALTFLNFMAAKSFTKLEIDEPIPVEPFLLSTETENAPTFFEVVFLSEDHLFRYGMEVDQEAITAEWLYEKKSSRETVLFTREGQEITPNKAAFKEGEKFKKNVRPNASFLSVCAALEGPVSRQVVEWFQRLNVISGLKNQNFTRYTLGCLIRQQDQPEILEFLRSIDVSLQNLSLEFPEGHPTITKSTKVQVKLPGEEEVSSIESHEPSESNKKAVTVHVLTPLPKWNEKGRIVGQAELELTEHASEGTQKLFAFAGPIVNTLKNGKVLFVDELDAHLHPTISCALVNLFNSPETNPHNAQLVFATHDVNLLSHRLFRRDQIWFTEKNEHGATHLYSLAQFRLENGDLPRKDSSFENDYIQGKFGAVPFLGNLNALFSSPATIGHNEKQLSEVGA